MRKKVLPLNHDLSVVSGVFSGLSRNISMRLNEYGRYEYVYDGNIDKETLLKFNSVDLMSEFSPNEDEVADSLFSSISGINYNKLIGYYSGLYAGHVVEGDYRERGTSGGFATWILNELLDRGEIDGVIHPRPVNPDENNGVLFKYKVSRTTDEIKDGAKARYYPMELSEVIREVENTPGRYAIVGISDFITEIRLLCDQVELFKERIVFTVGLFNAHQKSTKYAEALAWHCGVSPGELKYIDFRVKDLSKQSWDYSCRIEGGDGDRRIKVVKPMAEFPISRWSMGYFKSKFSDFTDNAFNELSDVTLGDAWLPDYFNDPKGDNIIIVRNPLISKILTDASDEGRVQLEVLSEEQIIKSQGLVSHIVNEIPYRLYRRRSMRKYTPLKRVEPSAVLTKNRKKIQDIRNSVVETNDRVYEKAVLKGDYSIYSRYVDKMNNNMDSVYNPPTDSRYKFWTVNQLKEIKNATLKLKESLRLRTRLRKIAAHINNKRYDGAIITLNDDFNYGNLAQRFALQRFLSSRGFNFVHLSIYTQYLQGVRDAYIHNGLGDFVDNHISNVEYDEVRSAGFKNYIVGSDQVWRNHGTDNLIRDYLPYWLSFVNDKKSNMIAYAASFGVDSLKAAGIDNNLKTTIKALLMRFNAVSLRESTGISLVDEIMGDQSGARHVLDPTLLLNKSDYSDLIDDAVVGQDFNYDVFSYILDMNSIKSKIIEDVSSRYSGANLFINPNPEVKFEPMEVWLRGFRDSKFVVTDSFHGVVFSVINNVDFIVISNKQRGLARIESLFNMLDIPRGRLMLEDDTIMHSIDNIDEIDWIRVNERIERLRLLSSGWLINNISKYKG